MTKLFIEGTAVSQLLSLFHFDHNVNYATLLARNLRSYLGYLYVRCSFLYVFVFLLFFFSYVI